MITLILRDEHERRVIATLMDALRDEWGFASSFGLDDLLNRWAAFVNDVEKGYSLMLEDYTQELAIRDSVEDLKEKLPERLRSEVEGLLQPLDQRFRFLTRTTKEPLLPVELPVKFWWYRLPNALHGDLLEAALAEHLI